MEALAVQPVLHLQQVRVHIRRVRSKSPLGGPIKEPTIILKSNGVDQIDYRLLQIVAAVCAPRGAGRGARRGAIGSPLVPGVIDDPSGLPEGGHVSLTILHQQGLKFQQLLVEPGSAVGGHVVRDNRAISPSLRDDRLRRVVGRVHVDVGNAR